MTTVYTYTEARQNLATLLDKALSDGEVRIRRRDGSVFVIRPEPASGSPLDIEGIDLGLTSDEILAFIAEGRRYGGEYHPDWMPLGGKPPRPPDGSEIQSSEGSEDRGV